VKDMVIFEDSPNVIVSQGLSASRLSDLEFFEQFVVDEHKNYISGIY